MNDLVITEGHAVATEKFKLLLTEYRAKELTIEEMKDDMKILDDAVMEVLEKAGAKSITVEDSDGVTHQFIRKEPTVRVTADTAKMKADGIFEEYSKTSNVKASLSHKTV